MLYPINDIFYSLQGEGYHTGKPVAFIRFSGCNLLCPWCDTDHSEKMELSPESIINRVGDLVKEKHDGPIPAIILTGGEPTIHDLEALLSALYLTSIPIAIETNGTNMNRVADWKSANWIQWVTLSPKISETSISDYGIVDEIKIVFAPNIDPMKIYRRAIKSNPNLLGHFYIQPCSENFRPAVEYVLRNPEWKLSLQTQKILKIK